jgi:hypothetical protein
MNLKKSWFVPGILILGIVLILASLMIPNRIDIFEKKPVAIIADVTGTAIAQGLDQIDSVQLKKDSKIKNLDLLKTESATEILVVLSVSGGEFRLLENTEALIEETETGSVLVTLRQGELMVDQFGQKPSFWIRKDGRQLTAMDYALSNEKNADQFRKQGKTFVVEETTLTQTKIEEILNSKKSDFFRCYGQLIQKTEQAHGQIILSFEISPIGKVVKVDVTKSDLADETFKSCVSEVIARTQFPRFNGKNMTTVFPLKFE